MEFGQRCLTKHIVRNKSILDVGALNVNGSLREWVGQFKIRSYIGVDMIMGPGVDLELNADDLVSHFGEQSFDCVISTEMLDHAYDWTKTVSNMKRVLRRNGHLIVTARSLGFAIHHEPDYWRYELGDFREIFSDLEILELSEDPGGSGGGPGVFLFARKPKWFRERLLSGYELYSMLLGRRVPAP